MKVKSNEAIHLWEYLGIVLLFAHNGPINQLNACLRQQSQKNLCIVSRMLFVDVVVDFQSEPN